MISLIPFAQLAVVGIASHIIERKIELAGYGHMVVLVRIATYVICSGIALYQWRGVFREIGYVFGIHVPW